MEDFLFTHKKELNSQDINQRMDFQAVLQLLKDMENQEETIFDEVPLESFEQVAAKLVTITKKGKLINDVQFLNHSVN